MVVRDRESPTDQAVYMSSLKELTLSLCHKIVIIEGHIGYKEKKQHNRIESSKMVWMFWKKQSRNPPSVFICFSLLTSLIKGEESELLRS